MKILLPTTLLISLLIAPGALAANLILGDYDQELRTPDGHFDTPGTLKALKDMGCNTYFYLIHHSKYDWDDLPAFADAAEREHIQVWVHINPWSETTLYKKNWNYSEPFRTDYVRWASEIAKLSLKHKNIVGFVIDDFYTNATLPDREGFTPKYTQQIHDAYKSVNPKLKFYPLMYFEQDWDDFCEHYAKYVDGVVGAYPRTEDEIVNADTYLRDEYHGPSLVAKLARSIATDEDEGVLMSGDFYVDSPDDASLSFYWDSIIREQLAQRGFHYAVAYVNGKMIWKADCADPPTDQFVKLDLTKYVPRDRKIHVELGMLERSAVHTFAIQVNFDNVRIKGVSVKGTSNPDEAWHARRSHSFQAQFGKPSRGKNRWNLPMILMPSANGPEHELRFNEPGSALNIKDKLHMALAACEKGLALGTVMFCTPKDEHDQYFRAVQEEYRSIGRPIVRFENPPVEEKRPEPRKKY